MKQQLAKWLGVDRSGTSYRLILRYFYPEFITALIIYSLPYFIDCYFICYLKSTSLYTISGLVENFFTLFIKAAEGLSIGTVIIAGYYNGLQDYKKVGKAFVDAFWTVIFLGAVISAMLYISIPLVCKFNHFTVQMICEGTPFLQIKSIGVFFMFVYFALVGFLRSIKNTFIPMVVFALGSVVFVISDYLFIFGSFGCPKLGLLGSAVAYVVQYVVMSIVMLGYILYHKNHAQYHISLLPKHLDRCRIKRLLTVTAPVFVDKVSIAFAYAWLGSCMSALGTTSGAAFSMIKLMERFAFLPAIAFSQIITFLVSNDLGKGDWQGIHANIKRVVLLAAIMVGGILLVGSLFPYIVVDLFDHKREFGYLVATVFPSLSILVMFDLLQLILSGALRGAGDVKTVMITRVCIILGYFLPVTYIIALIPLKTTSVKMIATYGSFLVGNGLMSIVYIVRLYKNHWKKQNSKVCNG